MLCFARKTDDNGSRILKKLGVYLFGLVFFDQKCQESAIYYLAAHFMYIQSLQEHRILRKSMEQNSEYPLIPSASSGIYFVKEKAKNSRLSEFYGIVAIKRNWIKSVQVMVMHISPEMKISKK